MCFLPLSRSLALLLAFGAFAESAEPKCDRYGDSLPEGAVARLGSLRLRNEAPIFTAAFTADGKMLVACDATSISFWDLDNGKSVRRVDLKKMIPARLRHFSSDGKTLILSGLDNVLRFVDAASGAELRALNHDQCGFIQGLDVSGDGKIAAAVHPKSIALWDVASGKLLHEFKGPHITPLTSERQIALTPDGKQLILTHADLTLHAIDVASGTELRAIETPPLRPGTNAKFVAQRLALSADGRYLAFGRPGTPLTVCEMATGKRVRELALLPGLVSALAFSPNGRFLATHEYNRVRLFGVQSGKEMRNLPLNPGNSIGVAFSPNGRMLAISGDGYAINGYVINLWDLAAERQPHPLVGHEWAVQSMAFFPDGKRLVSADFSRGMIVWDVATSRPLAQRTNNTSSLSLAVEADGEGVRYVGADIVIRRWQPRSGSEESSQRVIAGRSDNQLALSPDGRSMAIVAFNSGAQGAGRVQPATRQLRLHDMKTNKSMQLLDLPPQIRLLQLVFAPDSRRLAVSTTDGILSLWDRDTAKRIRQFEQEAPWRQPTHLAFAADGRSIAFFDGTARIREIGSGGDRLNISTSTILHSLAYSPDARLLACGQSDGNMAVYGTASGRELARWQAKQGSVQSLAFSRDSRLLASGGTNGTILIWEAPQDDSLPAVVKMEEAAAFWDALGESDAAAANRALAALAAAPERTLPLFKERLRPIGKPLGREQLERWIAELDDDSFKVRERATRELALAGPEAADALRQALHSNPSAESKRRIEDLLSRLKKGGDPQRLRFLRALEVLERIGTEAARDILRDLAGKPMPAELSDEVQASLRRMGDKQ